MNARADVTARTKMGVEGQTEDGATPEKHGSTKPCKFWMIIKRALQAPILMITFLILPFFGQQCQLEVGKDQRDGFRP